MKKSTTTRRKLATHLIAGAAGILLAALAQRVVPQPGADASAGNAGAAGQEGSAEDAAALNGKSSGSGAVAGNRRAAVLRRAWEELGKRPLNRERRLMVQGALLTEWATLDFDGALQAYLAECWDARGVQDWSGDPLTAAFTNAFAFHPLETWGALEKDKMARQLLGRTWVQANLFRDPAMLASMLGGMPENLQRSTIEKVAQYHQSLKPEQREAFYGKLRTSGTPAQQERWMQQIYQLRPEKGDAAALSAEWTALPAGGDRTRKMAGWASTLKGADAAKLGAEWTKVPEADRGQAARMLLSQVDNGSPALLDVFDLAVEAGEWQALANGAGDKLRGFKTDRQALAEWALTLPQRDELRGIFNLSISEKLLSDPQGSRAWLEQLPEGDWRRERGFNEMMLGQIWVHGNKESAQRALDSITDQRAKEQAIKDRYDWQLITGQEKMIRGE